MVIVKYTVNCLKMELTYTRAIFSLFLYKHNFIDEINTLSEVQVNFT